LKEYIRVQKIEPTQMIFPICYGAARAMVGKAGKLVGIRLRPHDLRRHVSLQAENRLTERPQKRRSLIARGNH
jgi:integrase/recombinase XerD